MVILSSSLSCSLNFPFLFCILVTRERVRRSTLWAAVLAVVVVRKRQSNGIVVAVRFRGLLCSRIRGRTGDGKKERMRERRKGKKTKSRSETSSPVSMYRVTPSYLPCALWKRRCSLISRSSFFLPETGESTWKKRRKRDVRSADSRKVSPGRVSSGLNGNSLTRPLKADTV